MPKPTPPQAPRWFFANLDDTEGPTDETETLWPTISSPEAQIRPRINLRVHSEGRYTVLGSGSVHRRPSDATGEQAWNLDTGRPVASHTVFFAAAPTDRFSTDRFKASGVDVTIVSNRPNARRRARAITRAAIARLIDDFGPFPMPRVRILLTKWGSGMEYYGATRTGLGSLAHELGHMDFDVTVVNRTWRDTWLDESAVVWWEDHATLTPVGPALRSSIGAGRPVAAPGFDESAYGAGARVLAAIARPRGRPGDDVLPRRLLLASGLQAVHDRRLHRRSARRSELDRPHPARALAPRVRRTLLSEPIGRPGRPERGATRMSSSGGAGR